ATGDQFNIGVGLSISKKIMEEHSGFIKADSNLGNGSKFTLYFPYQSEKEYSKIQCWQYMGCGKDCDKISKKCPAYPHFGRSCWAISGTLCEGEVSGDYAKKIGNCKRCPFYRYVNEKK
ncbi:MAG: ATP-binding protein, partial [Nitrospirae bacterium]